jgi:D-serine deaminase-like pyridoxal phosphate-dependent protein
MPGSRTLRDTETPALVLDRRRLEANVERMHQTLSPHRVVMRPHVKTVKNAEIVRKVFGGGTGPITVSTLAEAEHFFEDGFTDVLYAVGVAPVKLQRAEALVRRGCALKVILDSPGAAQTLRDFCVRRDVHIPALVEIDSDDHRAGVPPESMALLEVARSLDLPGGGSLLGGILTHAGNSYTSRSHDEIRAWARRERSSMLAAARRLREAGFSCLVVSVGSTPTVLFGESFEGIDEVRPGVFFFFDLVMVGLGVCTHDEIAISVLGSVIGHQVEKGWLVTDTGWMALSRDRGTAGQALDQGYGVVCDLEGRPLEDLVVVDTNQEHGIVARRGGGTLDANRYPVGTLVRVLPNHACATGSQHDRYLVVDGGQEIVAAWPRLRGF